MNEQLRQFTGQGVMKSMMGPQIQLTEELCKSQLDACAHLYGGGPPGLERLREYVRDTQTSKLESECEQILNDFIKNTCTPSNDSRNGFPYQCRSSIVGRWYPGDVRSNDTTLYGRIRNRAKESCIRPDQDGLTNEVEQIIAKIMDDVKLQMDKLLATKCTERQGTWFSAVFGSGIPEVLSIHPWKFLNDIQSLSVFNAEIAADSSWGACTDACVAGRITNRLCDEDKYKDEEMKRKSFVYEFIDAWLKKTLPGLNTASGSYGYKDAELEVYLNWYPDSERDYYYDYFGVYEYSYDAGQQYKDHFGIYGHATCINKSNETPIGLSASGEHCWCNSNMSNNEWFYMTHIKDTCAGKCAYECVKCLFNHDCSGRAKFIKKPE